MAYYGPVTQGPPIASPSLPAMGRGGDTVMGHLTPGEVVIPTAAQSPPLMQMVNASMQQQGMDPRQYTVGPQFNGGGGDMGGARGGSDRDGRDFDRTPRDTSSWDMIDAIVGGDWGPVLSSDSVIDANINAALGRPALPATSPPHSPYDPYGFNDPAWGKYKTPAVGGPPGELERNRHPIITDKGLLSPQLGSQDLPYGFRDDSRWGIQGPFGGDPLYGIDISAVGGLPGDRERESGAAWPHDDIDTTFSGLVDAPWGYSRTAFPPNQPPDIPDYPGRDVPVTYNGINYGGFHPQKVSYQDRMDRGWFADLLEDWGFPADPNDIDFDSVYNPVTAGFPGGASVGMSLMLELVRTMGDYFGDGTGEDHIYPGDEPHEHPVGAPHENRHKYYDEGPGDRK